jgi:2,4-dienoyl-CoA reductase-like NADH-dependent reductase (Old Yellow Enzyme family)
MCGVTFMVAKERPMAAPKINHKDRPRVNYNAEPSELALRVQKTFNEAACKAVQEARGKGIEVAVAHGHLVKR